MNVLVAHASWLGTTAEIAEAIAEVLRSKDVEADVCAARDVRDVSDSDAVVLGCAVRAGRPHGGLATMLKRCHAQMANVPVACFVACASMFEDTEKQRAESRGYLAKVLDRYPDIQPVDVGLFAGSIPDSAEKFRDRPFFEKLMLNAMMKASGGDRRDWDAIRGWARTLPEKLGRGDSGEP